MRKLSKVFLSVLALSLAAALFAPDSAQARAKSKKKEDPVSNKQDCILIPLQNSVTLVSRLKGHTSTIDSVAFSPDGKILAAGSHDRSILLWDVSKGEDLMILKGHKGVVYAVAFSPDGKLLASGGTDKKIILWDVETGRVMKVLKGSGVVNSLAFSPNGKTLASGGHDKKIALWDIARGETVHILKGHGGIVSSVAFSPDGKALASGSHDKSIILWNTSKGEGIRTLKGRKGVNAVAYSTDGKLLAAGMEDKSVVLWDPAKGEEVNSLKGHSGVVNAVAFSRDGKTLASGGSDKSVILWDIAKGEELKTLKEQTGIVYAVAFSPDGNYLAGGGQDRSVLLWDTLGPYALKKRESESEKQFQERIKGKFLSYSSSAVSGKYDKKNGGLLVDVAGTEAFVKAPVDELKKKKKKGQENIHIEGMLRYYSPEKAELVNAMLFIGESGYKFGKYVNSADEGIRITSEDRHEAKQQAAGSKNAESGVPRLSYEASVIDANKNNIIEGGEAVSLSVKIRNDGKGTAQKVRVNLAGEETVLNVIGRSREVGDIAPGEEKTAEFGGTMPTEIESGNISVEIAVKEGRGYSPTEMKAITIAMKPAEMKRTTTVLSNITDVDIVPVRPKNFSCNDCYAVVIGISKYRAVPEVKYASKDAETVMKYIESVGGVPRANVKFLKDDSATKADIESSIEEWLPKRVKATSKVYVYYAGHGTPDPKTNESYIVPFEGEPGSIKKLYPLKKIYEALNQLPAKKVFVMLDSCFSGSGDRSIMPEGARPVSLSVENPVLAGEKVVVLAASKGDEISSDYERVKHGLFTYYLLKGLKGEADGNGDGIVDIAELYQYVKERVAETALNELDREQSPMLLPGVERIQGNKFSVARVK